jgi:membrane-bound serine protease (ClpP class)
MAPEIIILLLIAGIVCIALEVYLPGGIIGISGAAVLIWAIVEGYHVSTNFGTMLMVCGVGGAVATSWFSFTYLTKTKEGKKALLMEVNIELPKDLHAGLEGKEGVTLTDMRPVGTIEIGEERFEASSCGEYIEKNRKVKVLKIEADRIFIREIV